MPSLRLHLFGHPRIELDSVPVTLRRRKATALLTYLVATQRPHSREALSTLLWPESGQTSARGNLRRVASELRQSLGAQWLYADRAEISFRHDDAARIDLYEFQALIASCKNHAHAPDQICHQSLPLIESATALYTGDFLDGFTLAGSPAFDDWQRDESERYRSDLAVVSERLGRAYATMGEHQQAVAHARRWVTLDPLHGPAQHLLLQLLADAGQPAAALRQYAAYAQLLEKELGLPVEDEIDDLQRQIRAMQAMQPLGVSEPFSDTEISTASQVASPLPTQFPSFLIDELAPGKSESSKLESGEPERAVFVAREHRTAHLSRFLEEALTGQGQVVFVSGEAGSGKTMLIHEFARLAQAAHADLIVASGVCDVFTGVGDPYLPFRDVLNMLAGDVEGAWSAGTITRDHAQRLWRLMPETAATLVEVGSDLLDVFVLAKPLADSLATQSLAKGPTVPVVQAVLAQQRRGPGQRPDQGRLFEEYTEVILALSENRPLMLLLDDLHWADVSSISLLLHLARRIRGRRVLIVGAYRPEELALGLGGGLGGGLDGGGPHPLEQVIGELKGRHGEIEIHLDQALRTEGRYFIDALLDADPNHLDEDFRQALFRHSRGHALFTVELLRDLQERGDLLLDAQGRWIEGPTLSWETLPARIEGVIEKRFNRLTPELRGALSVAGVEGERFTAEVVARVQAVDERRLVRRFSAELERRHRLVRALDIRRLGGQRLSRYRFRHNLFQQYLYNRLDDVERATLHEDVGNVLEELYRGQPDEMGTVAGQLAWHFQEAGIADKAIDYRYQAGQEALRLSANLEAIEHFTQGLTLLATLPDSQERVERELALRVALAVPVTAVHGYTSSEAEQEYALAWDLCRRVGDTPQLFTALYGLWRYYVLRSELTRSGTLADQLMDLAHTADDGALLVEAERAVGVNLFHAGELVSARQHLENGLTLYQFDQHHRHAFVYGHDPAVSLLGYLSHTLWLLGYPDQALTRIDELLTLSQDLSHPFSRGHALVWGAAQTHQFRREPLLALERAEEGLTLAAERGFPLWAAGGQILAGWSRATDNQSGDSESGIDQLQQGYAGWRALGTAAGTPYFLGLLADVYLQAGMIEPGLQTVTEALALVDQTGERWWEAELWRLRGELRQIQGTVDNDAIESDFQHALGLAHLQQAKSLELRSVKSLCRLWLNQGRCDEGQRRLSELYDWFNEGYDTQDLQEALVLLEKLS